jgi:hypothetical protein
VGREREIEAMDLALQRLRLGRDGRSAMLTGLRGVGKTVLLNEFEQLAQRRGYFHEHVEVNEDGDLPVRLASAFRRVLLAMDARRRIRRTGPSSPRCPEGLSLSASPNGPELSIDVDAVSGPADSGDLATDFAGLFIDLGEATTTQDKYSCALELLSTSDLFSSRYPFEWSAVRGEALPDQPLAQLPQGDGMRVIKEIRPEAVGAGIGPEHP